MGGEVEGVPDRSPVVAERSGFGHWLRTQRELRGVAREFVSDRTKLGLERIAAIERDEPPLRDDGPGRLAARALAVAIGADGDEAVRILVECDEAASASEPRRTQARVWRAAAVVVLLGVATSAGFAIHWLVVSRAAEPPVVVMHRPDYVQRALNDER